LSVNHIDRIVLQAAPRPTDRCIRCGRAAEVRYRRQWLCGRCLNPDPTDEYLRIERERANGQWGGTPTENWYKS
jgi:hypothetical protein